MTQPLSTTAFKLYSESGDGEEPAGPDPRLRGDLRIRLSHDAANVVLHGEFRQIQVGRDLFVDQALLKQVHQWSYGRVWETLDDTSAGRCGLLHLSEVRETDSFPSGGNLLAFLICPVIPTRR